MTVPARTHPWLMICLCCGITANDLPVSAQSKLVAIQEHAIEEHGFTCEEFPHQTRSDVTGLPEGPGYVWHRVNGGAWLLAIACDQSIPPQRIAELRVQHMQGSTSTMPLWLVEVGIAREIADGYRNWTVEPVAIPVGTPTRMIAETAIVTFWTMCAEQLRATDDIRHVWLHSVPATGNGTLNDVDHPFDPATLDPGLLTPKVTATCHTDDWAIDVGNESGNPFDATPFFASASDQDLRDLIAIGFGGDLPADDVAELATRYDPHVAAMFAYLDLPGKQGFECQVNEEQALAWLQYHRPHLLER